MTATASMISLSTIPRVFIVGLPLKVRDVVEKEKAQGGVRAYFFFFFFDDKVGASF